MGIQIFCRQALKLKLISGVIIVRFTNVSGCQGHAAQVDIRVIQDGLITLGEHHGNTGWAYITFVLMGNAGHMAGFHIIPTQKTFH
jgi:hypothetical protein